MPMNSREPLTWRRSTRCATGACVEVAFIEDGVLVRDSKAPTEPALKFSRTEWMAFTAGVRAGDFDDALDV